MKGFLKKEQASVVTVKKFFYIIYEVPPKMLKKISLCIES